MENVIDKALQEKHNRGQGNSHLGRGFVGRACGVNELGEKDWPEGCVLSTTAWSAAREKMKKLLVKLRKVGTLSRTDWLLIMKVSALLPIVRISLRIVPFKKVVHLFAGNKPSSRAETLNPAHAGALVELASRYHLLRPSCLEKAIVLNSILRRSGIRTELVLGTVKRNGQFRAHAWVEDQGEVILGGPVEPFVPLLYVHQTAYQRRPA